MFLMLAFLTVSCAYNDSGDLEITSTFWVILLLIITLIVIATVVGSKEVNAVKAKLTEQGIDVKEFVKCGNYAGGHPDIDKNILGAAVRKNGNTLEIYEYPSITVMPKLKAGIPITAIKNISVEDASSMESKVSLGRVLLVGIFALAWKKKKKNELAFVTIDWKTRFENTTIFNFEGKEAMQNANTARNALIKLCK